MKRLIFASAVIMAVLYNHITLAAAPAECFASSGAVFSAHPNAAHASYIVREKKPGVSARCWYADAFKAQAKADAKPALRSAVRAAETSAAETSALRSSITTTRARATAASPAREPHTTAAAPASQSMTAQLPQGIQPTLIAVNAQELRGFLAADEAPADFESRFSAAGYKAQK
jgi:hypothetical protein